jgi:hypothetical protein
MDGRVGGPPRRSALTGREGPGQTRPHQARSLPSGPSYASGWGGGGCDAAPSSLRCTSTRGRIDIESRRVCHVRACLPASAVCCTRTPPPPCGCAVRPNVSKAPVAFFRSSAFGGRGRPAAGRRDAAGRQHPSRGRGLVVVVAAAAAAARAPARARTEAAGRRHARSLLRLRCAAHSSTARRSVLLYSRCRTWCHARAGGGGGGVAGRGGAGLLIAAGTGA